jgi:beta-phosphoglucomutase
MDFSVIFDMDGVIVDNIPYHFTAWKRFSQEHGLAFDEASFKDKLFGRTNPVILEGLFGRKLPGETALKLADEKEALYRKIYKGHVRPAAGLRSLLKGLKKFGATTAVATAAPRANLDFALDETRLRPSFDALVCVEMVERGKPAPDLYLKAAELLGRSPKACVAVEDSHPGIDSALAAGLKVVAVTTTHPAADLGRAHLVIEDFRRVSPAGLARLIAV